MTRARPRPAAPFLLVPWLAPFLVGALVAAPLVRPARAEGAAKPAAAKPEGVIDGIVRMIEEGKLVDALDAAKAVGAEDASYVRARYLAGEIDLILGDVGEAEAAFREVLAKKEGAAPALSGLGRALLAADKPAEAIEPLEKAVAADAKLVSARAWLGLARSRAGKPADGKKDVMEASKAAPADAEVARVAVTERIEAKDVDGAMKAALAFSKAKKDHPVGPFLVAFVSDRAGKFDDAITGYEKAIALDASFLDAHKNLAILCIAQNPVYTDAKRTAKAMEHFAAYEKLGGRDASVLQIYGQLKSFMQPAPKGK